jgi:hypothetical protein
LGLTDWGIDELDCRLRIASTIDECRRVRASIDANRRPAMAIRNRQSAIRIGNRQPAMTIGNLQTAVCNV